MLTIKDLKLIGDLMDKRFEDFAILMQGEFSNIYSILETKADKSDIEKILETKADKTDIGRLEYKFEGRLERNEDNIRIVKTKLKLS